MASLHAPEYQYKVCSVFSAENFKSDLRWSTIKWGNFFQIQELDTRNKEGRYCSICRIASCRKQCANYGQFLLKGFSNLKTRIIIDPWLSKSYDSLKDHFPIVTDYLSQRLFTILTLNPKTLNCVFLISSLFSQRFFRPLEGLCLWNAAGWIDPSIGGDSSHQADHTKSLTAGRGRWEPVGWIPGEVWGQQHKLGVSPWFLLCCERCLEWWVCCFHWSFEKQIDTLFSQAISIVQGFCPREALTKISIKKAIVNLQTSKTDVFVSFTRLQPLHRQTITFSFQRLLSLLILPAAM